MMDIQKVELMVEGMNCNNCALGIRKQLEKEGFKDVSVSYANKEVVFIAESEERIIYAKNKIKSLGYTLVEKNHSKLKTSFFYSIEFKFFFSLFFTFPLLSAMFLPIEILHNSILQLCLAIPVFLMGLYHFGRSAWASLKSRVPNMDLLIIIGASASFFYSLYGTVNNLGHNFYFYETTAGIITLILLGNLLEHRSISKTTSAIDSLITLQKNTARKVAVNKGSEIIQEIDSSDIQQNDILIVNSGDIIPVDGLIIQGRAEVDESMLSGESSPVNKEIDDSVIGGTIINTGSIRMRVVATGNNTVLSHIIEMVKKAQNDKPKLQNLADKVSSIFVPVVISISLLTFAISYWLIQIEFQAALLRSIAVLVIACPCALGLAIPTAVVVGVGRMARNGILIKGARTIETIADIKKVVFDKTGTLTSGVINLNNIISYDASEKEVIGILYSMEKHSSHPIARSILSEIRSEDTILFDLIEEIKGEGIHASDHSGNIYKAVAYKAASHLTEDSSHSIYLIKNNVLIATFDMIDEVKPDAKPLIEYLHRNSITTVMLSGDNEEKTTKAAKQIGIDEYYAEQSPLQKLNFIKNESDKCSLAMVGDGINDAPALAAATIGISLSNATHIAIQSAQVILLKGKMDLLKKAHRISKITLITIKQNLFWAFFYNILAIPLAFTGILNPMIAAAAMALSDIFVILNSLRLRTRKI